MKTLAKRNLSWLLILALTVSLLAGFALNVSANSEMTEPSEPVIITETTEPVTEAVTAASEEPEEIVPYASYIYNWGIRGKVADPADFARSNAEDFYTGAYSFENLMQLEGSSTVSSVPNSQLYKTLKTLMASRQTYETSYGDTRSLFRYTDCQNGGGAISSFYSGISVGPSWDGGDTWNREHTWPNSKGNASGNGENDLMMLRPTSVSENSGRGNTAYGEGVSFYDPNKESGGKYNLRGDVARIMLYVYTRWGNTVAMWGASGVMESRDILLKWVEEDPVDTWELGRNDAAESILGTRNVYVDYPELIFQLFGEEVPAGYQTPSGSVSDGTSTEATFTFIENGTETITETTYTGTVYTLPEPAKAASGGWEFLGWTESTVNTTTVRPSQLYTAGSAYKVPVGDVTMYAVYTRFDSDGQADTFTLTDRPDDGDRAVIYNAGSGYAVAGKIKSQRYLDYGIVSVKNDRIVTTDSTVIWTVTKNTDGTYSFSNEGNTLSINYNGSRASLSLDGSNPKIALADCNRSNRSHYLYSATQKGKNDHIYLEWYAKYMDFSAYDVNTYSVSEANFGFRFYTVSGTSYYSTTLSGGSCDHTGGTPTCTQGPVCVLCGQVYGALADHAYTLELVGAEVLRTQATCTEPATYYYSCVCGSLGTEYFSYGATIDHSYVNNICTLCGLRDPEAVDLEDCRLVVPEAVEFTGAAMCPNVALYDPNGILLAEGRDYRITYACNDRPGRATVTVTGIGSFSGTLTDTFEIGLATVTGLSVTVLSGSSVEVTFDPVPGAQEYWIYRDGSRRAVIQETRYTMTGLTSGTRYSFYVKAAAEVDGDDYTGDACEKVYATPVHSLEHGTLRINDETMTRTGKARIPSVTVKNASGSTLKKGRDYKVSCENNLEIGTATVTVTGMGKYQGSLTGTFDIVPGRASTPNVTALNGVSAEVEIRTVTGAQWYDIYANGQYMGRTTDSVYIAEGLTPGTYYKFTVRAGVTIGVTDYIGQESKYDSVTPRHKAAQCQILLSQDTFVYTGKYQRPTVIVYGYGSQLLELGTDYTASFGSNKNTGRAYVKITGRGAYTGTAYAYYSITPEQVENLQISSTTKTSVKVSFRKSSSNSTKYYNIYMDGAYVGRTTSSSYTIKNLVAGQEHTVCVVPTKTVSGTEYTGQASQSIVIRAGTDIRKFKATLEYSSAVHTGAALQPSVTLRVSSKGKTLMEGIDYRVVYEDNTAPGKAKVIFYGLGEYAGQLTKTFTIQPQQVTGVTAVATGTKTVSVSFDRVEGATSYWVYVNGSRKAKITDTQCTISGLKAGRTYKITVKAVATVSGTNYTGKTSEPVSVKTLK